MEQQEKTFTISVEINSGLEPLTFTVLPFQAPALSTDRVQFKVMRDQETFGVLATDNDLGWKQLQGNMNRDEVKAIGAAIEIASGHTTKNPI